MLLIPQEFGYTDEQLTVIFEKALACEEPINALRKATKSISDAKAVLDGLQ
jgi:hypothetical protein